MEDGTHFVDVIIVSTSVSIMEYEILSMRINISLWLLDMRNSMIVSLVIDGEVAHPRLVA